MPRSKHIESSKRGLILDPVSPADFRRHNLVYACEQCSYYALDEKECMMGYESEKHDHKEQMRLYNLYGKMAFCRYMEVD